MINGDRIRYGDKVYLDAIRADLIDSVKHLYMTEPLNRLYSVAPRYPEPVPAFIEAFKAENNVAFAVRLREDDQFVGVCSLHNIAWHARSTQLKVGIFEERSLKIDFLTDIAKTILQYAYLEANLNRVEVSTTEDQHIWLDALKRTGFHEEGHLRQDVFRDGNYIGTVVLSSLRREWDAKGNMP